MTSSMDGSEARDPRVGWARLVIGLAQGVVLYVLLRAEQDKWAFVKTAGFHAAVVVALFAPTVLLAELGRTPLRGLLLWFFGAAAALAGLGAWTFLRLPHDAIGAASDVGGVFLIPILLFIAHHLVTCAIQSRRWIAPYVDYFDSAWRHALQFELSLLFLAIFWGVLWIGALLFNLIGIGWLQDLLKKSWFDVPVSAMVFAGAVHLTDVRISMVRGFRTLVLTLFSVLLPLTAGLSALFLLGVVLKGMNGLWAHKSTAGLLLQAATLIILFLNAAYQDGDRDRVIHPAQRWIMRAAPFVLLALALLATYAVGLRVAQYGWTPSRVFAAVGCLIIFAHGCGYVAAAVAHVPFMRPLEITNVATATLTVAVFLALLTPLADPARISVESQVSALKSGRVAPDKFDWDLLSRGGAKFGTDALKDLARSPNAVIAGQAKVEQLSATEGAPGASGLHPTAQQLLNRVQMAQGSAPLPSDFVQNVLAPGNDLEFPDCLSGQDPCVGQVIDIDHDGRADVLIYQAFSLIAYRSVGSGVWVRAGTYQPLYCDGLKDAFQTGASKAIAPDFDDLDVKGQRLRLEPASPCAVAAAKAPLKSASVPNR